MAVAERLIDVRPLYVKAPVGSPLFHTPLAMLVSVLVFAALMPSYPPPVC